MACKVAIDHLDKISDAFHFDPNNIDPLVEVCMTTLSSKIVGRVKRDLANICVKAVLGVADLERKDVNLELIKVVQSLISYEISN